MTKHKKEGMIGPALLGAGVGALAAVGGGYLAGKAMNEKTASLCTKIAGTYPAEMFNSFNDTFSDSTVASFIHNNPYIIKSLNDLTTQKTASVKKANSRVNVIQIRPNEYGYILKMSAAPEDMAPQETQVTPDEAQAAGVPEEAMQTADQQGVATMTDVQAAPDPMVEQPQPATSFGMYKVTDATSGRQVVGFVIPNLFDPMSGQPTQMSLFTTGNSYALQPQVMGVLTGISFNLPESNPPRGMGIFYKTDGKTLIATVPYTIISEVTVEGKTYYSAQTQDAAPIQLVISQGLQRPIASSQTEIAIPADFKFLPLDNPIQLAGGDNMMKAAQAAAFDTMAEIRAWDGGVGLRGPVFEKLGSGQHSWEDALFYLAASGLTQNAALPLLEKAAHTGEVVRLFGLRPLSSREDSVKQANAKYRALHSKIASAIPKPVNMLKEIAVITMDKEASAMVGTNTVDSVLALNFLNPDNVTVYAEYIPQLKESAEKLAELVLACQVGLSQVPKTAAVRAMFALENVIDGLLQLKEYKI